MKIPRPAFATAPVPATVEPLEDRRLLSNTSLLFVDNGSVFGSVVVGGVSLGDGNHFVDIGAPTGGLPSQLVSLPSQAIGLPAQTLQLPRQSIGLLGSPATAAAPSNLRGSYRGTANLTGFGASRFTLAVTRQRAGTLTVALGVKKLGVAFSGRAQVTFLGNRRFTFSFSRGSDQVIVSGRVNRDGTLSGTVAGQLDTRRLDGVFTVKRLSTIA